MEKLTEKLRYILEDCIDCISPIQQEVINKAVDRLAAYEDTGLEPEDIKRAFNEAAVLKLAGQALGITPDRLRELAQADRLLGKKCMSQTSGGLFPHTRLFQSTFLIALSW